MGSSDENEHAWLILLNNNHKTLPQPLEPLNWSELSYQWK